MGLLTNYDSVSKLNTNNETTKWKNLYTLLSDSNTKKTLNECNTISNGIKLIVKNNLSKQVLFSSKLYPNAIVNKLSENENKNRKYIA